MSRRSRRMGGFRRCVMRVAVVGVVAMVAVAMGSIAVVAAAVVASGMGSTAVRAAGMGGAAMRAAEALTGREGQEGTGRGEKEACHIS